MRSRTIFSLRTSAVALAALAVAGPAWAEDNLGAQPNAAATAEAAQPAGDQAASTTDQAASAAEAAGGDIVVTAQKRAENVQQVPISIAAFTGAQLTKANVVTVQDIGRIAT